MPDANAMTGAGLALRLQFSEGRSALGIIQQPGDAITQLLGNLGIAKSQRVLILAGGADGLDDTILIALNDFFVRVVAHTVAQAAITCIDGGTDTGVMKLLGAALAAGTTSGSNILLGVAPSALTGHSDSNELPCRQTAPLEPNHTHFLLTTGTEWGDETATMYQAASDILGADGAGVQLVVGGGHITLNEVIAACRLKWPIILLAGSGGTAEALAAAITNPGDAQFDPHVAEILTEADLQVISLHAPITAQRARLRFALGLPPVPAPAGPGRPSSLVLKGAWQRFTALDGAAATQQKQFKTLQLAILLIGIGGTALALLKNQWQFAIQGKNAGTHLPGIFHGLLFAIILLMPITLTLLLSAASHFRQGEKWLLLRGAAEAIRREIFRYRTATGGYRVRAERDAELAKQIEDITRRLARTPANTMALRLAVDLAPPAPARMQTGDDDGCGDIGVAHYLKLRLGDQVQFYRTKARKLERRTTLSRLAILIAGGAGTFLAAIDQQIWIALTTGFVGAITTYIGYQQLDSTLAVYNQTATDLENIHGWWDGLPPEAQADPDKFDRLVQHTEQVLANELGGWVQKMTDALADLRRNEKPDIKNHEKSADTLSGPAA